MSAKRTSRRAFALGAAGVSGVGLSAYLVPQLYARWQESGAAWRPGPFGPLRPDPDGILDLPEGFRYRILDRAGTTMDDGLVTPGRPDGMAMFTLEDGRWALLRNHELPRDGGLLGPGASPNAYDENASGGVSRVVIDPTALERVGANLVLAGTVMNCAGGVSPWGWLSCEETVDRNHGFVFVCDPEATTAAPPLRVPGYGRFRHEAAVVDPQTNIAYLTEDREDSCLYRFVPHDPSAPFEGELQALRVLGRDRMATGLSLGTDEVEVGWVPVREPTPDDDVVRSTAQRDGAALVARGEGIALHRDGDEISVVVSASFGGPLLLGQVLELRPDQDGGTLRALATSGDRRDFDLPDNLTYGPGGRIYFCEDGEGRDFLRGLDPRTGEVFDFARNALSDGELAGVCFSPDGRAMALNLQIDGLTLLIDGPFV